MRSRLWFIMASLVVASGLIWWMVQAVGEIRFDRGLAWARREVLAGRSDEPRRWLNRLDSATATRADVLDLIGVCEHAAGHYEAAAAAWAKIAKASPKFGPAALARARTLVTDLGRFAEAESVLEDALATALPVELECRHALSQLYFWEFRPDAMRRVIADGLRRWTDVPAELRDLWLIDDASIVLADVRLAVEAAERLAPGDDRVWLARAGLETSEGRFDTAREWLDRCLAKRPRDSAVWLARLRLARPTNDLAGALAVVKHVPGGLLLKHEILDLGAWMAAMQKDAKAERMILSDRLRIGPVDLSVYDRLAVLNLEAADLAEAARLRREKGDLDLVKDRYRRLLQVRAPSSSYLELASLAEALKRTDEAEGWWTLVFRQHPGDATAIAALERLAAARKSGRDVLVDERLAERIERILPGSEKSLTRLAVGSGTGREVPPRVATAVRFEDDAALSGLRYEFQNGRSRARQLPETTAGGVGVLDYDGDGWHDVYLVQGGVFPPDATHPSTGDRLFRNLGDGQFDDVTVASGIGGFSKGFGHGVTVGDFDNDGRPDLFLTRWGAYQLLRNLGHGRFEDVTERAGLGGNRNWPTSAAFADLDNDGDLDLYVCHYLAWDAAHPALCERSNKTGLAADDGSPYDYCMPNPFPAEPDHLFRNDAGRFVDVSAEAGIEDTNGRGLGVVAVDIDDDGRMDLFVANDTSANYLWHNLGNMKFEETGITSGIACNAAGAFQAGMGTAVGDLDGDERPDLFVTNFYGEATTYFQNMGSSLFADRTAVSGLAGASRYLLGFGIVLFDADNDGYLDLSTTNGHVIDLRPSTPLEMPGLLMMGGPAGQLHDVSASAGAAFQVKCVGRALATGDMDNDGRVDMIAVAQNRPLLYFHNRSTSGHGVSFVLEGTKSNRDGVGASVTVNVGGRERRAWRSGGGSFQSASGPVIHFGLGNAKVEGVVVRWPSGMVDRLGALEWDQIYRLREGDGAARAVTRYAGR